jgi:hypothetical protein
MFETLVYLVERDDIHISTKIPIVDSLFSFIQTQDQLNLAHQWLDCGFIFRHDAPEKHFFDLGLKHKYSILKKIFEDPDYMPEAQKLELLEVVVGDNKSDIAKNTRFACHAILPKAETKERIWKELTDPTSTESLYEKTAKMGAFSSWKQMDLIRPYHDRFFDEIAYVYNT